MCAIHDQKWVTLSQCKGFVVSQTPVVVAAVLRSPPKLSNLATVLQVVTPLKGAAVRPVRDIQVSLSVVTDATLFSASRSAFSISRVPDEQGSVVSLDEQKLSVGEQFFTSLRARDHFGNDIPSSRTIPVDYITVVCVDATNTSSWNGRRRLGDNVLESRLSYSFESRTYRAQASLPKNGTFRFKVVAHSSHHAIEVNQPETCQR